MSKLVALIGNPNVGKSTVFNELTGLNQHTGNWIGKTVDLKQGSYNYKYNEYHIVDLPGTYSLNANSCEEQIASDFVKKDDLDCIVCVIDATKIERSLILVYQVMELTDNIILLVNLCDKARKEGIEIDFDALSKSLGIPVVKSTAITSKGLNNLLEMIHRIVNNEIKVCPKKVSYSQVDDYEKQKEIIAGAMTLESMNVTNRVVKYIKLDKLKLNKLDKILLGRFTSILVTILLFGLTLWITIYFSNIPSQALKSSFDYIEVWLANSFSKIGLNDLFIDVFVHGMLKITFWVVAVMLPPMAIFFPIFSLMEDFGILPRLAFNLDFLFQKSGACGKQALTTCMGFGCNAVGVTSARIIGSDSQRLIAIITNSLTPCNGRFPFLIAIITLFMGSNSVLAAGILLCFIIFSYLITLLVNKILSLSLLKSNAEPFVMELPSYRKPNFKNTIKSTLKDKVLLVLIRAVVVAAPMGIVIWLLSNVNLNNNNALSSLSSLLEPFANTIGLDGPMLLAFILGFPANEIVMPIALMIYSNNSSLTDYSSLLSLKEILISNGWTIKTAICACVFSMFHFPCSTTLITIYREAKSIKWTVLSFAIPLLVGICACLIINIVL